LAREAEGVGLRKRFADFQPPTIVVLLLLRLAKTSRTVKWPNPQTVQLNMGLSHLTPDMIDPAVLGDNRLGASHFGIQKTKRNFT
jgi:hypothetical protein